MQAGVDAFAGRAVATGKKRVVSTRIEPSFGGTKFMTNLFSVKRTLLALGFCLWVVSTAALAAGVDLAKAHSIKW